MDALERLDILLSRLVPVVPEVEHHLLEVVRDDVDELAREVAGKPGDSATLSSRIGSARVLEGVLAGRQVQARIAVRVTRRFQQSLCREDANVCARDELDRLPARQGEECADRDEAQEGRGYGKIVVECDRSQESV